MTMIRVLVADDSRTTRALLTTILSGDPGIEVVGEAADGEEAVRKTISLRPDLVTMDIHMPGLGGLEATKEIMAQVPTPIIMISSAVTDASVGASLDATVAGALMALPTPSPGSDRFEDEIAHIRSMVKAMAGVKVVRRRGWRRREAVGAERAAPTVGIVAIAASTGGPAALHRILMDLPHDFPVPIVVVQHIARNFVQGLCQWLNSHCTLRVRIPEHHEVLEPRTVYLAPDERHLGVGANGVARLSEREPVGGFRPSGTFLFDSVAASYGPRAVAVILTGMGRDGAEGALAVRKAGGTVIAQDEATSVVYGMPAEGVRLGAVRDVLPVHRIGAALVGLVEGGRSEL